MPLAAFIRLISVARLGFAQILVYCSKARAGAFRTGTTCPLGMPNFTQSPVLATQVAIIAMIVTTEPYIENHASLAPPEA
jgi:hypothetical protein